MSQKLSPLRFQALDTSSFGSPKLSSREDTTSEGMLTPSSPDSIRQCALSLEEPFGAAFVMPCMTTQATLRRRARPRTESAGIMEKT